MLEGEGMLRELVPHRSRGDTTMKVLASHWWLDALLLRFFSTIFLFLLFKNRRTTLFSQRIADLRLYWLLHSKALTSVMRQNSEISALILNKL